MTGPDVAAAPVGAAADGSLSAAPVVLYLGAVAWVVGYDTIYALQDIEDDEIAGFLNGLRALRRARERHAAEGADA